MSHHAPPRFHVLSHAECEAFLSRHHVGRLAFSRRDHVDIEPMHYVFHPGWIYGRTSPGAKLETIERNRWVAFEVDEVHGLFHWTSVVAKGGVYVLTPGPAAGQQETYDEAVRALRTLVPKALHDGDPTPDRTVVFRIHVAELHGRRAHPGS